MLQLPSPTFPDLITVARQDLTGVNFKRIRVAYTELPSYNPYKPSPDMQGLGRALEARNYPRAQLECAILLEMDYLQIGVHRLLAGIFRELRDPQRARWHYEFGMGLMQSVLSSGNGRAPESAYQVVRVEEEYEVMRTLQWQPHRQQLIMREDRQYDLWRVTRPGAQAADTIYFDVSIMQSKARLFRSAAVNA